MLTKNCLVCGKEFTKHNKTNANKFCSRKCVYLHQDKRIEISCKVCSVKKRIKLSDDGGKFCSLNCYHLWMKGRSNKSSTKFKKGSKLSEETKNKMKGRIPWNKGIEWHEMRGKNHPLWKGGKTKLAAAIRTTYEYKKWLHNCLKRDSFTCMKCGNHNSKGNRASLHVHHLEPFSKLLDKMDVDSLDKARKCDELWKISNGQTLCIPCHKQTDSYLINQHTK